MVLTTVGANSDLDRTWNMSYRNGHGGSFFHSMSTSWDILMHTMTTLGAGEWKKDCKLVVMVRSFIRLEQQEVSCKQTKASFSSHNEKLMGNLFLCFFYNWEIKIIIVVFGCTMRGSIKIFRTLLTFTTYNMNILVTNARIVWIDKRKWFPRMEGSISPLFSYESRMNHFSNDTLMKTFFCFQPYSWWNKGGIKIGQIHNQALVHNTTPLLGLFSQI